ncbi:MAG TPA: 2-oxo-tetronate isomerase [Stellaceae bacterium]|jgi:2-dehydrotetronate isomerase|nr:2-oxo-tetronate isomerase [Stellaceae bacterium]
MPKLAANLSMMFQEVPFLDRFAAAADAGFKGVEYLFPYDFPAEAIAARLERHRLTQALFNLPPGDWGKGERGMAALPGRESEFMAALERALDYARATGCQRLHAMAGNWPPERERSDGNRVFIENLRRAGERAAAAGITLVIEPINTRDMPGYFLNTSSQAMALLAEVGRDNVKLQLDLYHCQIMEGDLATHIRRLAGHYAHVQIAGVPERHEPDRGEVNYAYLLALLDEVGYGGWVGCEYRPAAETRAGLGWARPWLAA